MKFLIEINDRKQLANIEAALRILDPTAVITMDRTSPGIDLRLAVTFTPDFQVKVFIPDSLDPDHSWEYFDHEIQDPRYSESDREQRLKELIRLGIITLVGKRLGKTPPWGILSGVRPVKIYHYLRDKGFTPVEIRDRLLNIYGLAPQKAELLMETGAVQEKYFRSGRLIGIYVGIPFCPTRCYYCSFAAVSLQTHRHQVKPFLKALEREIKAMSRLCEEFDWGAESIYLGGGTPSSLDEENFTWLLNLLKQKFHSSTTVEFTVEAGRPETVSEVKLRAMADAGVNRISINPQSMRESTLEAIGRKHSIAQVYQGVRQVKELSGLSLNMDLILGLPGETGANFLESLRKVIALEPESVTIHTLAPKRAAVWRRHFTELELSRSEDLSAAMEKAIRSLKGCGYLPYYLYRQRLILAHLENIGFAKLGYEGVYNIQMMEERQTILGLGGGGVTKWVVGPDYRVYRHQNPKCPATYAGRLEEEIVKKVQQSRLLLG